jgi:TonB-dependent receptor-like protein
MEKGAIILAGQALKDGAGTVLAAMSGKVPNFRVRRHTGQCPEITLRNQVSFQALSNPHVYVDGTRATDTCILESLRTEDVERIEVYPQGFTTRPGYGTHAHGLILVFMRSS